MTGEPSDTDGPPVGDTGDDEPDGPSAESDGETDEGPVTRADEVFGNGPGPDGVDEEGPGSDAFDEENPGSDGLGGPREDDGRSDGADGQSGTDEPGGTEVTVQVESVTDRTEDAEPEGRRAGRGDSVDRATGPDPEGEGSVRSEDELEREILDPEERIGPDEEHCRHCGAVFPAREDSCPDCGSPHPRSIDPPASTKKRPQLAAALSLLLPGAGHLYNEQFGRGAVAFFGTVFLVAGIAFFGLLVNVLVTVLSFGTLSALGTLILILALLFGWFLPVSVAAWDAYGQAVELNAG